jgi:hypothetical protein
MAGRVVVKLQYGVKMGACKGRGSCAHIQIMSAPDSKTLLGLVRRQKLGAISGG